MLRFELMTYGSKSECCANQSLHHSALRKTLHKNNCKNSSQSLITHVDHYLLRPTNLFSLNIQFLLCHLRSPWNVLFLRNAANIVLRLLIKTTGYTVLPSMAAIRVSAACIQLQQQQQYAARIMLQQRHCEYSLYKSQSSAYTGAIFHHYFDIVLYKHTL